MKKTAILFVSMGGPDCLNAVEPFLYNLFSDPDIIRMPLSLLLQKPFAHLFTQSRYLEVRHFYRQIGGRSPILLTSREQAKAVQKRILEKTGQDIPVYVAMRYWHPMTMEIVGQMKWAGIEHIVVIPLYPQFSTTTTGSSINELKRCMKQLLYSPALSIVMDYHDQPDYIAALADTIEATLGKHTWSCPTKDVQILFSAHSLPEKFVKQTGDAYPEQTKKTIELVMNRYFPEQAYELSFQSKVGKMKWLGPETEGILHYFAAENVNNVLMVPVSFVSEHIETLYEQDILYGGLAQKLGIENCHRAPVLGIHPQYIEALSKLALEHIALPEHVTA